MPRIPRLAVVACVVLTVAGAGALAAVAGRDTPSEARRRLPDIDLEALGTADLTTTTSSTTTAPPPPPTRPPTTRAPAPRVASAGRAGQLRPPTAAQLAPYRGLGTWVDVYDWSRSYTNNQPSVGPAEIDRMAAAGVQTLFLQAARADSPDDLVDRDLLLPLLDRAHRRGLRVVGWYLPTLTDPARDLRRLVAVAGLPTIDGLAVDIESREVADVAERNRRLVDLSAALRRALPGRALGAIVLPPVVLEVVNPAYWPNFPYRALASSYDVWQTMGYWTNRKQESGYRDAYRYTRENVDRLRANLGAVVPVHPIGGLGAGTSAADVEGYRRAVVDTGSVGGSLYDWRTTSAPAQAAMGAFRA